MFEDAVWVGELMESHRTLVAELATLEHLAHHLGGCPGPSAITNVTDAVASLPARLDEHMALEEAKVYPRLVERLGTIEVESMTEDHQQIRAWVERLIECSARLDRERPSLDDMRWTLLVVIGLVSLHLRREELAYVHLLRRQFEVPAS